jgi:hypothetical protein
VPPKVFPAESDWSIDQTSSLAVLWGAKPREAISTSARNGIIAIFFIRESPRASIRGAKSGTQIMAPTGVLLSLTT